MVYAIASIITENEDFNEHRENIVAYFTFNTTIFKIVDKLLNCIFCMSFWLGLISSFFLLPGCPFTYAFASYGIAAIIDKLSR